MSRRRASRGRKRRGSSAYSLAKKALRKVSALEDQTELKLHNLGPVDMTPAAAGTIIPVSLITEGDDVSNRTGRSIILKSIHAKFYNTDGVAQFIRVMLFFDTEQAGVVPTVLNVLNSADYRSFKNFNNRKRFAIIYDKTYSTEAWNDNKSIVNYYKKFNRKVEFIGADATQASQGQGNIYCLIISQANGTADSMSYAIRLRFADP